MILTQTYTEVYEILQLLGNEYINKLPSKLYEFIENQRDPKSIFELDINKSLEEQDISEEATDFIAYLNLEYWCSQEEKEILLEEYKKNDIEFEKELREKYNPDDIFKNQSTVLTSKGTETIKDSTQSENIEMTVYTKENIFIKIKNLIKRIFKFGNKEN